MKITIVFRLNYLGLSKYTTAELGPWQFKTCSDARLKPLEKFHNIKFKWK